MTSKMIVYQLVDNNVDYINISQRIKKFPMWTKVMDRCWIIKSKRTTGEIRDILSRSLTKGGTVFVIDLNNNSWGTFNVGIDITSWLKENLK